MNQRGHTTLVFLLPLLLSIFSLVAGLTLSFNSYTKTLKFCRHDLLASQEILNTSINSLINLNPEAKALRISRKLAESTLTTSQAYPPLYPAALAAYRAVVAKQAALHFTQLSLISNAKFQALSQIQALKKKILSQIRGSQTVHTYPNLAVEETPPSSASPSYQRQINFSMRQKISFRWTYPAIAVLPKWVQFLIPSKFNISGKCSSTISKRNLKWKARLSEDKFS